MFPKALHPDRSRSRLNSVPGNEIVWLTSFPKSGNTWFRIFLANLAATESRPADINNLGEYGRLACSRYEFEYETLLDTGLMSDDEIDWLRPNVYASMAASAERQHWLKVHDAYTYTRDGTPLMGRNVARAAIYLVRDPRDVAVSLAHQNSSSIDDAIKLLNDSNGALCLSHDGLAPQLRQKLLGWSGHVLSWLDQRDIPVFAVRYEDLLENPAERFEAAISFAGRSATREQVERAVAYADFDRLQRKELESGFVERVSRTAPFFRSGRVGEWRDCLTAAQIKAIEGCHGAVMARLGYEHS